MTKRKHGSRNWTPHLTFGLLCVVFVSWFPFRNARFSDNEGTYTSICQDLERGAKLYQDTWDNKPPFLYTQVLAVRRVLGPTPQALRRYVLILHVLDAFLLLLLLIRAGAIGSTAWIAAFAYAVFASSPNFQPYLAEADLLVLPFLLGSFCLAFSESGWEWVFSGVLWALAFFTKQTVLFLLPTYWPILKKRPFKKILWFCAGASTASLVIFLPFWTDGRLGTMLSAMFGIGHGMSGGYLKDGWAQFMAQDFTRENVLFEVAATALAVYSVALLLAATYLATKSKDRRFQWFLGLWLGISFLTCLLRGYFFTYYFFCLIPPLAVGFALGWELLREAKLRMAGVALAWLALFLGFNVWKAEAVNLDTIMGKYRNKDYARVEAQQTGEALRSLAVPGDKALVWSYEPEIYTYSGLGYSAIKSIWLYNLGKSQEELQGIEHSFLTTPPRFIVLHGYREDPPPPDWLQPFVQQAYQRLPDVGGYQIYQLKRQ